MGVVYGLAGFRDYGGRFSFQPHQQVRELRFHLTVRGQLLDVDITADGATYTLEQGDGLTIYHRDERLDLRPGEPVRRP
jgi:alpha,alpha-trehalose phosphorylase